MNRIIPRTAFFLLTLLLVSGCRTTRYDLSSLHLDKVPKSTAGLAIAVQDLRPFILSGEKPPSYIGIHRDGLGIPKDGANTASGKPLAEDIATALATNLARQGFMTRTFLLSPGDDEQTAIRKGTSPPADRIVILRMEMFRSDSWAEVELRWKFRLDIYDEQGVRLAAEESEGLEEGLKRNLTGAISDGQAQKALSAKLATILADLLASPTCVKALESGEWRHGEPVAPTEQQNESPRSAKPSHPQARTGTGPASLQSMLASGNYQAVRDWAKEQAVRELRHPQETLDFFAELIWEQRGKSDEILVDALAYLCLAMTYNQNPRYRLLMEVVRNEARTRKLRKYAKNALDAIPVDAAVGQYVPGNGQTLVPIGRDIEPQQARTSRQNSTALEIQVSQH